MKNLFICLLLIAPVFIKAQNSIYQLQIQNIEKKQIAISEYKGKKIIIAVMDVASPNLTKLIFLDSLLKQNKNKLAVILVPLKKEDEEVSKKQLKKLLLDSLKISYDISLPISVKKTDGANQHALFKWLTDKNSNTHFDKDVVSTEDVFIVNENGKLFGVFQNLTNLNTVSIKKNRKLKNF